MLNRLDPSNPKHVELRNTRRLAGPAIAAVGLVFTAIGLINFFSTFGSPEPPRLFWCVFVGGLIFMAGLAISRFAYLGAIARYLSNEVAPVGKDVVNYLAKETKDSVRNVAATVAEGLRSMELPGGDPAAEQPVEVKVRCRQCRALNDEAAKFCNQCGENL
ncbi:MAG: hypothetical protein IT427_20030 [Pirellulales bacterium]|nr:hypothetical protein [Pirellulales bacterium]